MKKFVYLLLGAFISNTAAHAETGTALTIKPPAVIEGPADWFTGKVRISSQFQRTTPARVGGAIVSFEPGARTAWHTHPLGQTLMVTKGTGLVQEWGKPIQIIREGEVVIIPAGVKHWHGAAPDMAMTHVAIQESLNGKVVDWMEQVTDAQYQQK